MLFTDELLNRLNEKLATKDAPIAEFEAEVDRLAARKGLVGPRVEGLVADPVVAEQREAYRPSWRGGGGGG